MSTADAHGVVYSDTLDGNTTLVGGSLRVSPVAVDDSYPNVAGNTRWSANATTGLLANDTDPDATPPLSNNGLTITPGSVARVSGTITGSLNVSADGSFTYDPPVGQTGTERFHHRCRDTNSLDSFTEGLVDFTVSGMV